MFKYMAIPLLAILLLLSGCGGGSSDTESEQPDSTGSNSDNTSNENEVDTSPETDSEPDAEAGDEDAEPDDAGSEPEGTGSEPEGTDSEAEGDQNSGNTGPDGSGEADNSPSGVGEPDFAGLLLVNDNISFPTGSRFATFTGGFYRVSDLVQQFPDALDFFDNVGELPANDECSITGVINFPQTISAGEVITVTGSAGTIASLTRVQNSPGIVDYSASVDATAIQGVTNLQFDIPGDEFPSFGNIQVPDSIPLTGITPALDATVTANTIFRWSPGTPGVTHMSIGMTFGEGISNPVFVGCFIVDDGEFSLPSNLRDIIGSAVATGWTLDRRHFVNVQNQSAIIQVQRYVQP